MRHRWNKGADNLRTGSKPTRENWSSKFNRKKPNNKGGNDSEPQKALMLLILIDFWCYLCKWVQELQQDRDKHKLEFSICLTEHQQTATCRLNHIQWISQKKRNLFLLFMKITLKQFLLSKKEVFNFFIHYETTLSSTLWFTAWAASAIRWKTSRGRVKVSQCPSSVRWL